MMNQPSSARSPDQQIEVGALLRIITLVSGNSAPSIKWGDAGCEESFDHLGGGLTLDRANAERIDNIALGRHVAWLVGGDRGIAIWAADRQEFLKELDSRLTKVEPLKGALSALLTSR